MPELQGLAFFPGVQQIISATYTLSHGISPSVAVLTIVPQADFPNLFGTLTFTFGGDTLEFKDMKVDKHSFRYDQSGLVWQIALLDKRWKWRHGWVAGKFNIREADQAGEILADSETTPRDFGLILAEFLGEAENNPDLSGLPDLPRPEVDWQIDNPAKALADLAEMFGCRVILDIGHGLRVLPVGVGAALPDGGLMAGGATIDPPERPDTISVICGPTLYQIDVLLEAVGMDRSGEIVPIDDLTYKPAGGWEKEHPAYFQGVGDPTKDIDPDRELAKQSVYRMYRITLDGSDGNPLEVPAPEDEDIPDLRTIKQLLPLSDKQAETVVWVDRDGTNRETRKPAMVWGTFYKGYNPQNPNTPRPIPPKPVPPPSGNTEYHKGFSIDGERGIVQFGEQVYYYNLETHLVEPAKLALRTACVVRNEPAPVEGAMAPLRKQVHYVYPVLIDSGVRPLRHEELVRRVFPGYSPGSGEIIEGEIYTNDEDIETEAQYYLEAAKLEYQQTYPEERVYMGLIPISPDGAIQQVTWNVGPQGATTQASRNTEHSLYVPPYKERRFLELLHGGRWHDMERAAKLMRRQEWFRRLDGV